MNDRFPPPPPRRPRSMQSPLKPRHIGIGFSAFVILIILVAGAATSYDHVEPGQVAVIKNNLFNSPPEVQQQTGIIIHLPFGLTDVYRLDKRNQVFEMSKETGVGDRHDQDNIKIKVADGSNVEVDVKVEYRLRPAKADLIVQRIGPGNAFKNKLLRGYTRAVIREAYGKLTLEMISDPASRTGQNQIVRKLLNDALEEFGLEVIQVNTTNFVFNPEYNRLVKEKKATAQDFLNQSAAQEQARKEQETRVASFTREKNTALITARGKAKKRIVEASNRAKQLVARAKGEAYSKEKDGDRSYEVAVAEAQAVEAEGLNTATGIQQLAEAYRRGGLGLVKEAISKKMLGAKINGRPYSLSEDIKRIKVDRSGDAPAVDQAASGN
jgi:regulator of protease activity HflC (stomatin/prohibitin superfamily)